MESGTAESEGMARGLGMGAEGREPAAAVAATQRDPSGGEEKWGGMWVPASHHPNRLVDHNQDQRLHSENPNLDMDMDLDQDPNPNPNLDLDPNPNPNPFPLGGLWAPCNTPAAAVGPCPRPRPRPSMRAGGAVLVRGLALDLDQIDLGHMNHMDAVVDDQPHSHGAAVVMRSGEEEETEEEGEEGEEEEEEGEEGEEGEEEGEEEEGEEAQRSPSLRALRRQVALALETQKEGRHIRFLDHGRVQRTPGVTHRTVLRSSSPREYDGTATATATAMEVEVDGCPRGGKDLDHNGVRLSRGMRGNAWLEKPQPQTTWAGSHVTFVEQEQSGGGMKQLRGVKRWRGLPTPSGKHTMFE